MSNTREIVEDAYRMTGFDWKPLYPNNMPCNGQEGFYAIKLHELEDGVISGRKYTIFFQRETDEEGCLKADGEIEFYILFEKSYYEIVGRMEHPEPSDEDDIMSDDWKENTLHACEVNDRGNFCKVCKTLDEAKKRALEQYQIIFGYALSHLL